MIKSKIDDRQFMRDMENVLGYSIGFIEGVHAGKKQFLNDFGQSIKKTLEDFIDVNARVSPESLSHVYEWYRTGSPDARLFEIRYSVTNSGLSFNSTFRQSSAIRDGSKVPFYDKARIMEKGVPVKIKPVQSKVLSFNANGEQVFIKKEVTVQNPGGASAQNGFEKTFNNFFERYLSQSFLLSSGIIKYLENPVAYKDNLRSARIGGKAKGYQTGYRWIVSAGAMGNV